MEKIKKLVEELEAEIGTLDKKFLAPHFPTDASTPDQFDRDVKAFCVLAHAVFEEFAEQLTLIAIKVAEKAWLEKKFCKATITLISFYQFQLVVYEDDEEKTTKDNASDESTNKKKEKKPIDLSIFNRVRKGIEECISNHSIALHNNHGFSIKYLRNILTPVAIEIPENDVRLMTSLKILGDARGSFAHSFAKQAHYTDKKQAKILMAPEKARETVQDCLDLCKQLSEGVQIIN